jgi:hypothetical protein
MLSLIHQGAINGLDLDGLGGHYLLLFRSKLLGSNVSNDIRYCLYIHKIVLFLHVFSRDLQIARCSRSL